MQFVQAVTRAAALKLADPRFAYLSVSGLATGVAVRGEDFWSFFCVTESGAPPAGFMGELKSLSALVRANKASGAHLEYVNQVPLKLNLTNTFGQQVGQAHPVVPLIDAEHFWPAAACVPVKMHPLASADLRRVLAVVQRAPEKDVLRPGLRCVRFVGEQVEAGDEAQFCRAPSGLPVAFGPALVTAASLQKLKVLLKGAPFVGLTEHLLLVESHGERRAVRRLADVWVPQLGHLHANLSTPSALTVPAAVIQKALKPFSKREYRRFLRLRREGLSLNFQSLSSEVSSAAEVSWSDDQLLDVVVSGERLASAVRLWTSSEFELQWDPTRGACTPLLFWGTDGFREILYPMLEVQA